MSRQRIALVTACAGLALGLIIALTANITYGSARGPVVLGIGIVAPLVLPLALYIRTLFDAPTWKQWLPREVATLLVAGPAVGVSYWHTFSLVLDAGEPLVLAILAPLSSDGLAGIATLALHRLWHAARQTADEVEQPRVPDARWVATVVALANLATAQRTPPSKPEPRKAVAAAPKRTEEHRAAERIRKDRSRRHAAGDHSMCLPRTCPHARPVRPVVAS